MATMDDRSLAEDKKLPTASTTPSTEAQPVDEVPSLEAILACDDAPETARENAPENAPENASADEPRPPVKRRGFALMDRSKVREIARRGAAASQAKGTAHRFTADEARAAGRKGGAAPHRVRGRGKRSAAGAGS
jgi:general stress protein YciG